MCYINCAHVIHTLYPCWELFSCVMAVYVCLNWPDSWCDCQLMCLLQRRLMNIMSWCYTSMAITLVVCRCSSGARSDCWLLCSIFFFSNWSTMNIAPVQKQHVCSDAHITVVLTCDVCFRQWQLWWCQMYLTSCLWQECVLSAVIKVDCRLAGGSMSMCAGSQAHYPTSWILQHIVSDFQQFNHICQRSFNERSIFKGHNVQILDFGRGFIPGLGEHIWLMFT